MPGATLDDILEYRDRIMSKEDDIRQQELEETLKLKLLELENKLHSAKSSAYSKQAKDILHQLFRINSGYHNSAIDKFVDCIINAAVEEVRRVSNERTDISKEST